MAKWPPLPWRIPLLKALEGERAAREALKKAEGEREAASQLQLEWEAYVQQLSALRERCERAQDELANAKAEAKAHREKLFSELGNKNSQVCKPDRTFD
jgi:hypothetical protein